MKNTLIIATKNPGKAAEFKTLFEPYQISVKTLLDFPEIQDVEETGTTFVENATLKAETISNLLNCITLADDSGLAIDALNGEPGVYSARYAGEQKSDEANIDKVLINLEDVPMEKRMAQFHCVLAVAIPEKETQIYKGTCDGVILHERKGENGFGYDSIFFIPQLLKTFAELSPAEKNKISHRAKAMQELSTNLNALIEQFR